jgi:site-specific DNA-methyltransferase (adenine-specific)
MTPYWQDDSVTLHQGDCLDVMRDMRDTSVDSVCTDPPYSLGFMGRSWDTHAGPQVFQEWCREWAAECLRLLKPGGYLTAFGGTRTHHRLTCGIEDAGFEICDSIGEGRGNLLAWVHGQGFPKSSNHLKPAWEPIVVARKPLVGTLAQNVTLHGTGALNIDGCRTPVDPRDRNIRERESRGGQARSIGGKGVYSGGEAGRGPSLQSPGGRWPTNVVLDEDHAAEVDRQSGVSVSRSGGKTTKALGVMNDDAWTAKDLPRTDHDDRGGASRFFPVFKYTAKAGSDERPEVDGVRHPTVKPLDLMRWLVRLVTPPNGLVLDPFAGSGTTAEACVLEHFKCIAIEREPDYLPLIKARLSKPMEIGFDFGEAS